MLLMVVRGLESDWRGFSKVRQIIGCFRNPVTAENSVILGPQISQLSHAWGAEVQGRQILLGEQLDYSYS